MADLDALVAHHKLAAAATLAHARQCVMQHNPALPIKATQTTTVGGTMCRVVEFAMTTAAGSVIQDLEETQHCTVSCLSLEVETQHRGGAAGLLAVLLLTQYRTISAHSDTQSAVARVQPHHRLLKFAS